MSYGFVITSMIAGLKLNGALVGGICWESLGTEKSVKQSNQILKKKKLQIK